MNGLNCHCQEYPELVDLHEYRGFLNEMTLELAQDWHGVYRCNECGQKWVVDVPDKLQKIYAIRGDNTREIELRTKPLIIQRIVDNRGGLDSEPCIWNNCENRRVRGMAMCADHLYAAGHRE